MARTSLSILLSSALLFSLPALAKDQALFDSTATVALSGMVEVPLVDALDGTLRPAVWVQMGDDPNDRKLFILSTNETAITVEEGALSELGAKIRGKAEAPLRTTVVEKMSIGGLVLTDVGVSATPLKRSGGGDLLAPAKGPAVGKTSGVIGLGALQGVAWAILPSKGVVRFAPAAQGAELLAAVGGTPVKTHRFEGGKFKAGGERKAIPSQGLLTELSIGGVVINGRVDTGAAASTLAVDQAAEGPVLTHADLRATWLPAGIGDQRVETWVNRVSGPVLARQWENNDLEPLNASLGADVLGRMDLAWNPGTGELAARLAPQRMAASPLPTHLEIAEAKLKKAIETQAAEGKAPTGEGAIAGDVGAWKKVANARGMSGKVDEAVVAWKNVTSLEAKACDSWLGLGEAELSAGNPAGAETAFAEAARLYHGWWDYPMEVRQALQKRLDKVAKDGGTYTFASDEVGFVKVLDIREVDVEKGGPPPKMPPEGAEIKSQPGTCHVADGRLAAARLAAGRADGVEPLYRAHMDLDAGLALVTGNSLIIQGKPEAAVEPYRQAVLREYGTGPVADHRTGLALTYVAAGDRGTADGLLWRNVELAPRSPFATFPWVDNQVQLGGAPKAVEAARALSVSRPDSVAAHLALHRAAVAAGDEAARTEALMRAGMTVEKLRASEPNAGRTWGLAALVLAAQGKGAEAVDAAKQARTLSPADALSWWASAEAATVAGDAAAAAEFRKRAGIAEPSNAGLLALTKAN